MLKANKIIKQGCLLFSLILFVLSLLRNNAGRTESGISYFIASIGFLILYFSYRKRGKKL